MPEDDDTLQTDRIHLPQLLTSLSSQTRRTILMELAEDNPRDKDEITSPAFNVNDEDLEQFAAKVSYEHLPHLHRAGLIEWDRDTDTIVRGPNFEEVRPLLTLIAEHQDELPDDWLGSDG